MASGQNCRIFRRDVKNHRGRLGLGHAWQACKSCRESTVNEASDASTAPARMEEMARLLTIRACGPTIFGASDREVSMMGDTRTPGFS